MNLYVASMPVSFLLIALVASVSPPDGTEAYRLDRVETRKLNNAERAALAAPAPARVIPARHPAASPGEQALRAREEQALGAWRQRAAACRTGDRTPCDPS